MDQDRRSNDSARCFQFHAIPVHEKHLRSSRGPETRFAAKMFPLERFIATPVLLPLTFVEEASSVRRAMLSVRRAIFCRAHRGSPIELASDRIPGVGDERLSSRYPSGVEHRDPRAGIPSAGIPWNQRVWQFDSPSTNTTLLLRFGEAVKSVEARFGSRFPPEAVTIKSDPKTDRQLLGAHPEIWKWNRNDRRGGRNHLSPSML
jgi:hypothetical protein